MQSKFLNISKHGLWSQGYARPILASLQKIKFACTLLDHVCPLLCISINIMEHPETISKQEAKYFPLSCNYKNLTAK
jgi:hypothetical protein